MWNPPIALTPEEQKIAARTRKTRKFFVFLRERRHELLDVDFQTTLATSYSPEPGGKAPVAAGVLALATLLPAYCHVGDRDAVELTVMDKRWQMVLGCLGAEPPPFSQGTRCNFRLRLMAHDVDKVLLERTVALAEQTGGFGARQLRAALDSTPWLGAGRVEETLTLLGHARRKVVGLAAAELGTSAAALIEEADLVLVGHSRLNAALDLDGGEPTARVRAWRLVLAEVERWKRWLAQQARRAVHEPPRQEAMATLDQMIAQDTEPDPDGSPGGRRIAPRVTHDRRISIEDNDRRHGRKSSAKTFNGVQEHWRVDLDSTVTREVVVRPANEPEHEVVELLAAELENSPGLLQLDLDWGSRASPRMAQWAAQGVHIMARPWPQGGERFTTNAFGLDFGHGMVACPGGVTMPMAPGRTGQCPARACDACRLRPPCTHAQLGHGRSLHSREDEPCQQKLRATISTTRGRGPPCAHARRWHLPSPSREHIKAGEPATKGCGKIRSTAVVLLQ